MTKLTMNTTGTTKNRALATTEAACATPRSNATAAVVMTSKRPISTQPAIPFPRFLSFASEGGVAVSFDPFLTRQHRPPASNIQHMSK